MSTAIAVLVNGQTDHELTQAESVEVTEMAGETATFRLRYDLEIHEGDLPLLADSRLDAGSEISVVLHTDNEPVYLIKGPVHGHNIRLKHGGTGSTLEVSGSDTSVTMDRETRSVVWSDLTDSDAVSSILRNYGYLDDVEATAPGHYENKHTLVQRESDLSFVRRLGRHNGYFFWITCDPAGVETAHFRRPQTDGTPSAQLVINLDSPNLTSFGLEWDVERPTGINGAQLDLNTKNNLEMSVEETPLACLGNASLRDITGDNRSVHLSAPVDDAGDLHGRGEGAILEAAWFISASCKTTSARLGTIVRPCALVDVRGAGSRHSGTYFVSGVIHTITAEDHHMEIKLIRNGWQR